MPQSITKNLNKNKDRQPIYLPVFFLCGMRLVISLNSTEPVSMVKEKYNMVIAVIEIIIEGFEKL